MASDERQELFKRSYDGTVHELAEALRALVEASGVQNDFVDLACALIIELSRRGLTISHAGYDAAAERTFVAFTEWLQQNPRGRCTAIYGRSTGQIHVAVSAPSGTRSFAGINAQEAYAKAAQVLLFERTGS